MADPAMGNRPEPGIDPGLESVFNTLRGLLTAGETLEAWARAASLVCADASPRLHRSHERAGLFRSIAACSAATNPPTFDWQDLKETRISAGILAADLTLVAQSSSDLTSDPR